MERQEIESILQQDYGTSNALDVPEPERWQLYEILKSNIRFQSKNPDDYTRQLILISDTLEL